MAQSLEKKAEKNIIDSIDKLVANSFLMLLFESLIIQNHPILKDTLKEKSIKGIYDYTNQTITDLRRIVDEAGDEKEFHLRKTLQMKQMLTEVYDNVKIYISACNIIDLCIEERLRLLEDDENDELPFSELKRLLKEKTEQFLDSAVNNDVEEAACAILLTILPNCFTDRELIDYITYSGQFYFDNSSHKRGTNHLNLIMRSFAPQRVPEYGKYYPKEAEKLLSVIDEINTSGLEKSYKKLGEKYDRVLSKIEGIAEILSSLYTELTYISIILSSMFAFDDILKGNLVYSDYYNKTVELLNADKLDEAMADAVLSSLDKTIEKEVDLLNELAKRKELLYKNVDFESFSENTKTLFSMEFYMTTAFFESIEDSDAMENEISEMDDKKFADLKAAQKEIRALKLFIKENCISMNESFKKGARRNLFLSVPLVSFYDKNKMMKYIDFMCSEVKTPSEIEGPLSSIEKLIEEDVLLKLSVFEQ